MPSPGLKHATRHYLLRIWSFVVEMSGGHPLTSQTSMSEQQGTESYLRPPDEFEEYDRHHTSLQESRRPQTGGGDFTGRDRGMLRHGECYTFCF